MNNTKFDSVTVNQVIENLSKAQKLPAVRKTRTPKGLSEIQKTLDALLPTVEAKIKEGFNKKQIYSEIVKSGISFSGGTWNTWLKRHNLVKARSVVAS